MTSEIKFQWHTIDEIPPYKVGDFNYTGYLVYSDGCIQIADYAHDKY